LKNIIEQNIREHHGGGGVQKKKGKVRGRALVICGGFGWWATIRKLRMFKKGRVGRGEAIMRSRNNIRELSIRLTDRIWEKLMWQGRLTGRNRSPSTTGGRKKEKGRKKEVRSMGKDIYGNR